MVTALLPGFRDIRTALTAGYMWLVGVWLLALRVWPPLGDPRQLVEPKLLALLDNLHQGWFLAVLTVTAVLLGEMAMGASTRLTFSISRRQLVTLASRSIEDRSIPRLFRPMSNRAAARLRHHVNDFLSSGDGARNLATTGRDPLAVRRATFDEVLFLAPRLVIAKPELYAEHMRVRAESEFRDAISLPLPILVLGVSLHLNSNWAVRVVVFLAGAFAAIFLFVEARSRFRTCMSMIAHSVADQTIATATTGSKARPRSGRGPDAGNGGLTSQAPVSRASGILKRRLSPRR
jgi:hypothetical protein